MRTGRLASCLRRLNDPMVDASIDADGDSEWQKIGAHEEVGDVQNIFHIYVAHVHRTELNDSVEKRGKWNEKREAHLANDKDGVCFVSQ